MRINIRVAAAAAENSTARSLKLAFFGGAISAILSAALCILGVTTLYTVGHLLFVLWGGMPPSKFPIVLAGPPPYGHMSGAILCDSGAVGQATASVPRSWRCSCSSEVASTPRRRTHDACMHT